MIFLKQSTSVVVNFGPFVDKTDGVSLETGLATAMDNATTGIRLSKNGAAYADRGDATVPAYDAMGDYRVTLSTTDTGTLGVLRMVFEEAATTLPVWKEMMVVPANVYDSLVLGTDELTTDVVQWLGTAAATPTVAGVPEVDITHVSGSAEDISTATALATAQTDLDTITGAAGALLDSTATSAQLVDDIWDEQLTVGSHNIGNSAGRRLRQIEAGFVLHQGTAQAASTNTITLDTGASTADDFYNHTKVVIEENTGLKQERIIVDYVGSTRVATIAPPWVVTPDNTSIFVVEPALSHAETNSKTVKVGIVAAATSTTVTLDSTASATDDYYNDDILEIDFGTGEGQARVITDYVGSTKVATVTPAWITTPDTTSEYIVEEALTVTGKLEPDAIASIWDRVISKANHNVAQSAGKILRQGGDLVQIDGAISDVSPTTSSFDTDLTQADGFFDDSVLIFTNGSANAGIGITVSSYLNANGNMTFDSPDVWPVTPVNGDDFVIYATHVHPVAQIADAVLDEALSEHSTAGTLGKAVTDIEADATAILADTNELQSDDVPGLISTLDAVVDTVKVDTAAILADTASMGITKNATFSNFEFPMVLTSDHYTAATSKTVTGEMSIDGAAFASTNGTIAEIGSGVYQIDLTADDTNGDVITYKFSATSCDDTIITVTTRA